MDDSQVLTQLTEIIRDVLNNDTLTLTQETVAADVPEWDSFNHINIVVATEVKFGIKFKTAELEQVRNVGEFVALIERKLDQKKG
ncbi:MAG TPA: acyl carrier protein [Candidatus Acidoferrum sp.]|nr:acyl carrier protein [Candidatus Acidoferrum sp.]